jgi:lipopolysaccharide/colanic/teichoic acid biosynthesis glycosyltransferase
LKRIIDFSVALVGLLALIPLLLCVALLIRFNIGSPVLFFQIRPGLNEKPFTLIKFRTMNNELNSEHNLSQDSQRLSRFGIWLRKTSIDEIPELWNVLKGDMSLVGPRPLLLEYLPLYNDEQKKRHEVLPGITGWAQVNGRNNISWNKKLDLDIWYINNRSLFLDMRIIFMTIKKVIEREGISAAGEATVSKFTGSNK